MHSTLEFIGLDVEVLASVGLIVLQDLREYFLKPLECFPGIKRFIGKNVNEVVGLAISRRSYVEESWNAIFTAVNWYSSAIADGYFYV